MPAVGRFFRDALTAGALLTLSGVTAVGVRQAFLPLSEVSGRWAARLDPWLRLMQTDLAEASLDEKKRLVRELESALDDEGTDPLTVSAADQEQLTRNLDVLAPLWLEQQMDDYFRREEGERDEWLDGRVNTIIRWANAAGRRVKAADGPQAADGRPAAPNWNDRLQLLQRWTQKLEESRPDEFAVFRQAVMFRLLAMYNERPGAQRGLGLPPQEIPDAIRGL